MGWEEVAGALLHLRARSAPAPPSGCGSEGLFICHLCLFKAQFPSFFISSSICS